VIFADQARQAHARRWTNRQSGRSAVRDGTAAVLIVAEALHDGAAATTMPGLTATLAAEISALWPTSPRSVILTAAEPRFTGGRP
jgi:DNA/RNA-binding domain of Phe-tRNA-synthetase-like protein